MNKLYIVNDFDRPNEEMLAEERNGLLYYIHPETAVVFPHGMTISDATELSDFGVDFIIEDGWVSGRKNRDSIAQYKPRVHETNYKATTREWRGSNSFLFKAFRPTSNNSNVVVEEITGKRWAARKLPGKEGYTRKYEVLTENGSFVICNNVFNPADAELIASAPDLLRELRELHNAMEKMGYEEIKNTTKDLLERLRGIRI